MKGIKVGSLIKFTSCVGCVYYSKVEDINRDNSGEEVHGRFYKSIDELKASSIAGIGGCVNIRNCELIKNSLPKCFKKVIQ